ncbi:class I SAM-dependent methyltransferase [Leptolyngbya sp. 7M]|uniref:class I SAM-dependent methyltransferase n=1 Tax=Leptolyngbya sp. 7M TaxID=2812896 RepID=UPI001B8CA2C7|nr:class I SAM-dependent methyltransferase [Leptolyngbya sp. 7M]QYO68290.1 class I SAM-dependent methyltransferase [Leptolyngbya sp. 7M]
MNVNEEKLNELLGRFVGDLGATLHAGLIVIGAKLGLYKAMATPNERITAAELAKRTGTNERYIREWLNANAAGGYVEYDADTDAYFLSEEQVFALTSEDNPAYLPGAFILAAAALKAVPQMLERFKTGEGLGWHEHDSDLFCGTELFFRPGYNANLVNSWIPALEGVEEKLCFGARVADVGCGLGASTIIMAQAYPNSEFVGFDYHDASIEKAKEKADAAGVSDRVKFEVASSKDFPGDGYDLITFFDCLHDMGDPVGTARHVKNALIDDGTWMIVEPFAKDTYQENHNPVGRVFYSASTLICTPASRSQEVGLGLGAQAGEARLRQIATDGGFTRFRRATETPFNMILEARP